VGLQVNYGRRFLDRNAFDLYDEINFLASPLRDVSSSITSATKNFASPYVTSGVRLKKSPRSKILQYFAIGCGYADYEQSSAQVDGPPNPVPGSLLAGRSNSGQG